MKRLFFFFLLLPFPALATEEAHKSILAPDDGSSIVLFGLILMFVYTYTTWRIYGKDPKREIFPRYDVPKDVTAAQAGYIYTYGERLNISLTMAFLQMFFHKFLKLSFSEHPVISQERSPKTEEEKLFAEKLELPQVLKKNPDELDNYFSKTQKNRRQLLKAFRKYLKKSTKRYFKSRWHLQLIGFLIFFGIVIKLCLLFKVPEFTLYLLIAFPILYAFYQQVINVFYGKKGSILMVLIIFGLILYTIAKIDTQTLIRSIVESSHIYKPIVSFYAIGSLFLSIYMRIIGVPTSEGNRLFEHIDGIKLYLQDTTAPLPTNNPLEVLEKLIPYALLLDLEEYWETKLDQIPTRLPLDFTFKAAGRLRAFNYKVGDVFDVNDFFAFFTHGKFDDIK